MGSGCFTARNGDEPQTPRPPIINGGHPSLATIIQEDLNAYVEACGKDRTLESYDKSLHELTAQAIISIAEGTKEKTDLPLSSIVEAIKCLIQMNQGVVDFIKQSKADVWKDEEFSSLVTLYFKSSAKLLQFCNALEDGVARAKLSLMHIQSASREFEKEAATSREGDNIRSNYKRTLEELKKFEEAGKPFKEDFFKLYELVYDEQTALLDELYKQKQRLVEEQRRIGTWKQALTIVSTTVVMSVLVLFVVEAVVALPPVVAAVAGALPSLVGAAGTWCNKLWRTFETEIKGKLNIVESMLGGTRWTTRPGMENVRALARSIDIQTAVLLEQARDAATGDEQHLRNRLNEIKEDLQEFVKKVQSAGKHAKDFICDVAQARREVIDKIFKFPARQENSHTWMVTGVLIGCLADVLQKICDCHPSTASPRFDT